MVAQRPAAAEAVGHWCPGDGINHGRDVQWLRHKSTSLYKEVSYMHPPTCILMSKVKLQKSADDAAHLRFESEKSKRHTRSLFCRGMLAIRMLSCRSCAAAFAQYLEDQGGFPLFTIEGKDPQQPLWLLQASISVITSSLPSDQTI